jgi:hypothetical protein
MLFIYEMTVEREPREIAGGRQGHRLFGLCLSLRNDFSLERNASSAFGSVNQRTLAPRFSFPVHSLLCIYFSFQPWNRFICISFLRIDWSGFRPLYRMMFRGEFMARNDEAQMAKSLLFLAEWPEPVFRASIAVNFDTWVDPCATLVREKRAQQLW